MNKVTFALTSLFLFFFVIAAYGFDYTSLENSDTRNAAVTNLLIGLNSDNYGLRTSSAFMLGEIKAEEAVIPLMRMLRTEKNEDGRIVAAFALYKINSAKAIFAVKQAIKFDDSERVRKMCSNFYQDVLRTRYGFEIDSRDSSDVAFR